MSQNYSLLFYLKKPRNYVNGPKPIYMRITVKGIPKEISTGRTCDPLRWNAKANRVNGVKEEIKTLNSYLDTLERKIENIHSQLMKSKAELTTEAIKNEYLGIAEEKRYLLEIFQKHNHDMESLLGNGFKSNTLKGYKTSFSHLSAYLTLNFKSKDIDIISIDHSFIVGYEFYLRSALGCSAVSAAKYMKHLRKIINSCIAHRWILENPFLFYKNTAKAKEREYLSQDELNRIFKKHFFMHRLVIVKDIFLFCCYTGLSYIDVKNLRSTDIGKGIDGNLWILTNREKTNTATHIPLIEPVINLISKYKDHPESERKGLVFPVLSNQKMNSYLKEIADMCGITKVLTFHMARHTFATTVTLSNGVPIESVSKMLGHTNLKTTQHYAKILDIKVGVDMALLSEKLAAI